MLKNIDRVLISPSIIAADLTTLGEDLRKYNRDIVDLLHIDVMDGNFVPNLTIGPGYIKNLRAHTDIPLDVHLMIERPERTIEQYIETGPWGITINYESTRFPARILDLIREQGIIAGLSINPATPVEAVFDLVPCLDMVLVMSVDPGFYGQPFMAQSIRRIERLSEYLSVNGHDSVSIQVDGGINRDNIASVVKAGAGIIVAGSSAYKHGDINTSVLDLKKSAHKDIHIA